MLRSALYATAVAVGAAWMFAGGSAQAHPPTVSVGPSAVRSFYPAPVAPRYGQPVYGGHDHRRVFTVMYRECAYEPWCVYAVVRDHERAHDLARQLRRHGLESFVRHSH